MVAWHGSVPREFGNGPLAQFTIRSGIAPFRLLPPSNILAMDLPVFPHSLHGSHH
jgi:hypothetical protein